MTARPIFGCTETRLSGGAGARVSQAWLWWTDRADAAARWRSW